MPDAELATRLAGAVWGHLVADAVGVPYEFRDASQIGKVSFGAVGTHGQPPGTWSDDGALMLALLDSLLALRRENKEVLWSSMIKDTMKRKKPSFNETYYGFRTFSELLEEAQRLGILELDTDSRSRTISAPTPRSLVSIRS